MKQLTIIQFLRLSFLATVSLLWSTGVTAMPIYTTTIVTDDVVASVAIEFQDLINKVEVQLTADYIKDITLTSNGVTLSFDSIDKIFGRATKNGGNVDVIDLTLKATNATDELYIGSNGSYYNIVTTSETTDSNKGNKSNGGPPDWASSTGGGPAIGVFLAGGPTSMIPEPPMLALIFAGLAGISGSRMIRRRQNQNA